MPESDDRLEPEIQVSKSEIKRDMLALQKLAERLVKLTPGQWEQQHFGQKMMAALEESRRVKGHNAMRRHIRRLGKLLREEDSERVVALFRNIDGQHEDEKRRFHRLENWRDRLMHEGETALSELLQRCPDADRQRIQQFIRAGKRELEQEKPPSAQRKLFKYLKELPLK
ncbi:MAG: DUF615 domain-containing protein [Gammaproteobacteria bacterium]|nr:DUF615 domain-containing protein [Gammaproteobacteria bacterium]